MGKCVISQWSSTIDIWCMSSFSPQFWPQLQLLYYCIQVSTVGYAPRRSRYPLYIINTIDYFWPQFSINSLTLWTVIMSHMSCALNPLIYAYGMPGFKKALRAFFNIQTDANTCANYSCYMSFRSTGNQKQRSISVRGMPYEHSLAAIRKISAPTPVMIDRHRSRRRQTVDHIDL
ncbi:hypothetical protein B9Z55_007551 [Caenorhabditis nigoni]|uniref:G-protein coupled receptors family 1 profile domain-containing protein n=1 Tax=Caenorhabditis nigoni TaxID=1611254 RepID=A0A2G5VA39_9PELO|nr:hypothetical protein B9Z55_007551 [Caenorhabditis nigoni]